MTPSERLRHAILGALALGLPLGCGGRTADDGSSSGGTAGSGGASSTGGQSSGGTGGKPVVSCSPGTKLEECYTPEQAWSIANNPPQGGDVVGNCPPAGLVQTTCCNPAQASWEENGQCCYAFCEGACCGRPFTVDGVVQMPELVERADWLERFDAAPSPSRSIADAWLRDARMEHASIASFARFTLELLAFGAPPELVADAQAAMGDEVEHARVCFGLAVRFGATPRGPGALSIGAFSPRSLEEAAVAAFREGGVAETIAALSARRSLERASDPLVKSALARIADDEERHAALAFRFLAFALERGGPSVRSALERELAELRTPRLDARAEPLDVSPEVFRAAGRASPEELEEAAALAVRDVTAPCLTALLAGRPAELAVRGSAAAS